MVVACPLRSLCIPFVLLLLSDVQGEGNFHVALSSEAYGFGGVSVVVLF